MGTKFLLGLLAAFVLAGVATNYVDPPKSADQGSELTFAQRFDYAIVDLAKASAPMKALKDKASTAEAR